MAGERAVEALSAVDPSAVSFFKDAARKLLEVRGGWVRVCARVGGWR